MEVGEAVSAVIGELSDRGRHAEMDQKHLVLDTQIAYATAAVAARYRDHWERSRNHRWAARLTVDDLLAQEVTAARASTANSGAIRLRVGHPSALPTIRTLPGPADFVVYPVVDGPAAVTRLGGDQTEELGGLEEVCLRALAPTLAEPIAGRVQRVIAGATVTAISGDVFLASRLLDLPGFLAETGFDPQQDAIICAPSARELWVAPVGALPVDQLAAACAAEAAQAYAETSSPLSPASYLWSQGELKRL